ncbi:hypothetical protein Pelo_18470 [Pelomyxa schiedti]|nr:hypothetical protein Pelo_18470 [Pelomyxa schiedti]
MTGSQGLGAYWDRPFICKVDTEGRFSFIAVVGGHTPIMINRPYCPTNSFAYGKQPLHPITLWHGIVPVKAHAMI